jgi:hypothetical protein
MEHVIPISFGLDVSDWIDFTGRLLPNARLIQQQSQFVDCNTVHLCLHQMNCKFNYYH